MKKLVTAALVLAMTVGCLAGCSGGSGTSEEKNANAFYIGGIGPTTGAAAIYGNAAKNGAQIAIDEKQAESTARRLNTGLKTTRMTLRSR